MTNVNRANVYHPRLYINPYRIANRLSPASNYVILERTTRSPWRGRVRIRAIYDTRVIMRALFRDRCTAVFVRPKRYTDLHAMCRSCRTCASDYSRSTCVRRRSVSGSAHVAANGKNAVWSIRSAYTITYMCVRACV